MAEPEKIDINRANREQLETVDNFDTHTVDAILEYREKHGGFESLDELEKVPGLGGRPLELVRHRVEVSEPDEE